MLFFHFTLYDKKFLYIKTNKLRVTNFLLRSQKVTTERDQNLGFLNIQNLHAYPVSLPYNACRYTVHILSELLIYFYQTG